MNEQQGSSQAENISVNLGSVSEGFGFGGTSEKTVTPSVPAQEGTKESPLAVPDNQEPAKETEQPVIKNESTSSDSKAREAHRQVIDLLSEKFADLKNGRTDDMELREWFDQHPEFADVANRSKRVKDEFRSLMSRDQSAANNPDIKSRRDEQTQEGGEDIDDLDKPLTLKDLVAYQNEMEERTLERTLERDRDERAENFAAQRNIVDDQFVKFREAAEVLTLVNPDWSFEEAMEAAQRALYAQKGSPMDISTNHASNASPQSAADSRVDMTESTPLMSWEDFTGKQVKGK